MYWFVFLPDVRVTEYIEQLIENRNGWSLEEAKSRASNYSRGVLVSVSKWLHRTSESHLLLHYVCLFSSLSFAAIAGKKEARYIPSHDDRTGHCELLSFYNDVSNQWCCSIMCGGWWWYSIYMKREHRTVYTKERESFRSNVSPK
jgi:hypothetical protein